MCTFHSSKLARGHPVWVKFNFIDTIFGETHALRAALCRWAVSSGVFHRDLGLARVVLASGM